MPSNTWLRSWKRNSKEPPLHRFFPINRQSQTSRKIDIDQLQFEAFRRMTGEDRLRIELGLYEASLAMAREAIRNRFPDADDATVEEKLRARVRAGYEIQS